MTRTRGLVGAFNETFSRLVPDEQAFRDATAALATLLAELGIERVSVATTVEQEAALEEFLRRWPPERG